jgi:hypothetical protein
VLAILTRLQRWLRGPGHPRCGACGASLARLEVTFPLHAADALITALDLADPSRLARLPVPAPQDERLTAVLLACPRGHHPGRLRLQATLEGRLVHIGAVYELYEPFLGEVRALLGERKPG